MTDQGSERSDQQTTGARSRAEKNPANQEGCPKSEGLRPTVDAPGSSATETEWRPIPSLNGRYEVSRDGAVRSVAGAIPTAKVRKDGVRVMWTVKPRVLRQLVGRRGYLVVSLGSGGGTKKPTVGIHRLVCEAFNGPPPFAGALCRHLNDKPLDNRPENLAWGTLQDNADDAIRNGLTGLGERNGSAKLTNDQVRAIRARGAAGECHYALAETYLVGSETIQNILRGRKWRHLLAEGEPECVGPPARRANIMARQAREDWLVERLREERGGVDVCNRDLVQDYIGATGMAHRVTSFGANNCTALGQDLARLVKCGRLSRVRTGIRGMAGTGLPSWAWLYKVPAATSEEPAPPTVGQKPFNHGCEGAKP